jgi:phosphoketolase
MTSILPTTEIDTHPLSPELFRIIKEHTRSAIFLAGPSHGATGVLAPVDPVGTYSEIDPDKSEDEEDRIWPF